MKRQKHFVIEGATQQFNGREAKTATLFVSLSVSLTLRDGGYAPHHFKRYNNQLPIDAFRLATDW